MIKCELALPDPVLWQKLSNIFHKVTKVSVLQNIGAKGTEKVTY